MLNKGQNRFKRNERNTVTFNNVRKILCAIKVITGGDLGSWSEH